MLPIFDINRQYKELKAEINNAVNEVLEKGNFILGENVKAFEKEFAAYAGTKYAVGVASGTDALYLICKALGFGEGDEVITTPFTFIATADAIVNCGAKPVFADIDPRTFNIDPLDAEKKVSEKTRAILAVHIYGQPADMKSLKAVADKHDLLLIEDCAQAHGAVCRDKKIGTFGKAAAFSFFPTKPLGGVGDGGIVCTDDEKLFDEVRMLRVHGAKTKYFSETIGINSRLDEIQAAVLRIKLRRLDDWNNERRMAADAYRELLKGVETPYVELWAKHVYHLFTIKSKKRDEIKRNLEKNDIVSNIYFPLPLHRQKCFDYLGLSENSLPVAEAASREVLSLPIFSGIGMDEIEKICASVNIVSNP